MKNLIMGLLSCALLLALVFVYSNHFHNALQFDDSHTIVENPFVKEIKNIPLFFKDGTTFSVLPQNQSYRPFLSTTLAWDFYLGASPERTFYFHLSSFLFFLFSGIGIYFLYLKMTEVAEEKPLPYFALLATALFLVHPICAETVNYIIQRGDILATLGVVTGLGLYAYSPSARKYYVYLIPVLLGMLSKVSAIVFAPILFLYVYLIENKASLSENVLSEGWKALKSTAVVWAFVLLVYFVMSKVESHTAVMHLQSPWYYRFTQPYILGYYFLSWFDPSHLNIDTDWQAFTSYADVRGYVGIGFVLVLGLISLITAKYARTRPIAFGVLWFLVGHFPTSFVPLSEIMNDHRMFLPLIGLNFAIVWSFYLLFLKAKEALPNLLKSSLAFYALFLLMGVMFANASYQRNEKWKTGLSIWQDCVEKSPKNGRAWLNYGHELANVKKLTEAEAAYLEGLKYSPNYPLLYTNLGAVQHLMGKVKEADANYQKSLQLGNTYVINYFYGRFLFLTGKKTEGIALLKKSIELSPAYLPARTMLTQALFDVGDFKTLREVAEGTLKISPNDSYAQSMLSAVEKGSSKSAVQEALVEKEKTPANLLNLSLYYYNEGKYELSIKAAEEVLQLSPTDAGAYNNIGAAYIQLKNPAAAIEILEKALSIDSTSQLTKNNLNWAKMELAKGK